jgi:hypothetical protein
MQKEVNSDKCQHTINAAGEKPEENVYGIDILIRMKKMDL